MYGGEAPVDAWIGCLELIKPVTLLSCICQFVVKHLYRGGHTAWCWASDFSVRADLELQIAVPDLGSILWLKIG